MRLFSSAPYAGRVDSIDLKDPALFSKGDPHSVWQAMRERAPVHWQRVGAGGFWSITKWSDASRVLRDFSTFTSQRGTMLSTLGIDDPAGGVEMTVTDPPRHSAIRVPLQQCLHANVVERHVPAINAIVHELLGQIPDDEPFDFAATAMLLSVSVAGVLLDLPREDLLALGQLAFAAIAPGDDMFASQPTEAATLVRTHQRLFAYFYDLTERRAAKLGDDLVSVLFRIEMDGKPMSQEAVLTNCYSLLLGASVTTPQAMSATLSSLVEREQYAAWAEAPDTLHSGVEEALRWSSPANHFMRHATRDVEIRDTLIRSGDAVVVWLGSANRDVDAFEDPYTFDPRRTPNRHLAFGVGPHHCVGHAIGRLTLRIAFKELFKQFAGFSSAGAPEHLHSNFIAGIRRLPLVAHRRGT